MSTQEDQREPEKQLAALQELEVAYGNLQRANAALRESETRFRATFEQAAVGIAHVAPNGSWLRVNQRFCDILGYSHNELLHFAFQELTHPDDLEADLAYHRRMLSGEIPTYSVEKRYLRKDGSPVWVNLTAAMVRTVAGDPEYFISVIEDISARKQAEEEVRKLNAELELRVAQRTDQLAAANSELEAFAYSVSHDLRAPLRAIDGFSQALIEDYSADLDPAAKGYLGRVRAGAQRMAQLIDDLLKLSRVSRAELRFRTVDLSKLAAAIVEELRQREPERQVEVVVAPGQAVEGDERLLRIALENLLDNAWKFTGKTGAAHIDFGVLPPGDGELGGPSGERSFFVRDNGAGFDMAYAGKLFGAFQRLHQTSEFPGTGIGLTTAQRIIHRHGGRIWGEGEIGRGATFCFTLPVRRPVDD